MKQNSNFEITYMCLADLENIKDILETDFDNFWNYNVFKGELENPNSTYFVVKYNNEIIGFAGALVVLDEADITNINLAYIIEDGMKIHIPSKEEKESTIIVESNIDSGTVEQSNEIKSNNNKKLKININTATKTDLETLPGIGESTALKIIEYRKEKGKFKLIEDIKQVNGIGENKFNKIKELITV